MATKELQTLKLKFDMFNSLVFASEINFKVTFAIFSVSVTQTVVLESHLDSCLFQISYDKKYENCDNLGI